jgi:membrane protein
VSRINALVARLQETKVWRAWNRYGEVRGNVLAGGIAYFAFFSLVPALIIGFTVFGLVLGGHQALRDQVVDYVNNAFGGATVIGKKPDSGGIVSIDDLVKTNVLTWAGASGLVLLLFSGLGWVGALRDGISAVFGQRGGSNPVITKLRDVSLLAGVGVAALASVLASLLVNSATGPVLDWFGLGRSQWASVVVSVFSSLVLLVIDTGVFLLLLRLMAGVRLPIDDLFTAALSGGVALGLLKVSGGVLLRYANRNQFFAAFAIVVGLLVWMNLVARLGLLVAAWAATTADDRGHLPAAASAKPGAKSGAVPAPGAGSGAAAAGQVGGPAEGPPGDRGVPNYGARAADRTTLLAGAVLGATAAVGVRVLGTAGKTVRNLFRARVDH